MTNAAYKPSTKTMAIKYNLVLEIIQILTRRIAECCNDLADLESYLSLVQNDPSFCTLMQIKQSLDTPAKIPGGK